MAFLHPCILNEKTSKSSCPSSQSSHQITHRVYHLHLWILLVCNYPTANVPSLTLQLWQDLKKMGVKTLDSHFFYSREKKFSTSCLKKNWYPHMVSFWKTGHLLSLVKESWWRNKSRNGQSLASNTRRGDDTRNTWPSKVLWRQYPLWLCYHWLMTSVSNFEYPPYITWKNIWRMDFQMNPSNP